MILAGSVDHPVPAAAAVAGGGPAFRLGRRRRRHEHAGGAWKPASAVAGRDLAAALTAVAFSYTVGGMAGPAVSGAFMQYLPADGLMVSAGLAGGCFLLASSFLKPEASEARYFLKNASAPLRWACLAAIAASVRSISALKVAM